MRISAASTVPDEDSEPLALAAPTRYKTATAIMPITTRIGMIWRARFWLPSFECPLNRLSISFLNFNIRSRINASVHRLIQALAETKCRKRHQNGSEYKECD